MQNLKKLLKSKELKIALFLLSVPILVKVLYFVKLLGIYFGGFLRSLSECIG